MFFVKADHVISCNAFPLYELLPTISETYLVVLIFDFKPVSTSLIIFNLQPPGLAARSIAAIRWKICQGRITWKLQFISKVLALNLPILKDGRHCVGLDRVL
ncbi:hypothetical protein SLA2020_080360 [Shorea laevis]